MPKHKYICPHCSGVVLRWKSTVRASGVAFCNKECKGSYQIGRNKGEDNPNYKLGIHCKPCLVNVVE